MRTDKSQRRIPKYFHSDGNGVHLEVGKNYKVRYNNNKSTISVLGEYRHFYLTKVNDTYKLTINKYHDDIEILYEL